MNDPDWHELAGQVAALRTAVLALLATTERTAETAAALRLFGENLQANLLQSPLSEAGIARAKAHIAGYENVLRAAGTDPQEPGAGSQSPPPPQPDAG